MEIEKEHFDEKALLFRPLKARTKVLASVGFSGSFGHGFFYTPFYRDRMRITSFSFKLEQDYEKYTMINKSGKYIGQPKIGKKMDLTFHPDGRISVMIWGGKKI